MMTLEKMFSSHKRNIAKGILDSLLKCNIEIRMRAAQNIILSGGNFIIPGFKARLVEEVDHVMFSEEEYSDLRNLKGKLNFATLSFPSNCLVWLGASLSGCLGENEKFLISLDEYKQKGVPDRYGDVFLNFKKVDNFFNKDAEELIKKHKQMSSTLSSSSTSVIGSRQGSVCLPGDTLNILNRSLRKK